jgi:hypothetical protein
MTVGEPDFDWSNPKQGEPLPLPLDEDDLQELLDWDVPFPQELSRAHGAAVGVLASTMGRGWVSAHANFLIPDPRENFSRALESIVRTIILGETLYNLQATRGYSAWRAGLRGAANIEAFYGEVLGARHLARTGLPFTFVRPRRARRMYDARILKGSRGFPIELKGKLPGTPPTEQTVFASLKSARGQLPRGRPGLVLLTVPSAWAQSDLAAMNVLAATNRLFRGTTRVAAVCISWDAITNGSNGLTWRTQCNLVQNPKWSRARLSCFFVTLEALARPRGTTDWTYFKDLVSRGRLLPR